MPVNRDNQTPMKSLSAQQLQSGQLDWPVHMQRALDLAATVISTHPNPRVGCVIVKHGQVLAEGWHRGPGQAHAEAMALQQAASEGRDVRGATVFVTLEPCAHHGRTPPCCEALIAAGVGTVVLAVMDPNPQVSGKGIAAMEQAGITVFDLPEFAAAAQRLNRGYFMLRHKGRPWVTVKSAMSLDGRTAMADGEAKWITGAAARADVQRLRLANSAVVTGINTVLLDDPSLNVRPESLQLSQQEVAQNQWLLQQQPMRVVLDSKLRTPGAAKIVTLPGKSLIYTTLQQAPRELGNAVVHRIEGDEERVNLQSVLESLAAEHEVTDVLIEAGPTLSGAFIRAGLVDELIIYVAPKLLGSDARPLMEIAGLDSLKDCIELEWQSVDAVGQDLRLTLRLADKAID